MPANPFISKAVDANSTDKFITAYFPDAYAAQVDMTIYYAGGTQQTLSNLNPNRIANSKFVAINEAFYSFFDVSDSPYYNQEFSATNKTIIGIRLTSGGQQLDLVGSTTGTSPLGGSATYAVDRNNYFDGQQGEYVPSNWTKKPINYTTTFTYQPVADHTAFVILSASYEGAKIEVSFNKQVDTSKIPTASFFSITANAQPVSVSSVAAHATDNTKLVLTLSAAPPAGAAVNMSYTDQSAFDDAVGAQDMQGRDAGSFSAQVASAGSAATITGVTVPANGVYKAGNTLDFTVQFSEAITVDTTGGTPALAITLDTGGTAYASYVSGSGGTLLTFRYTVASGQADSNGIALGTSIALQGGTLKDGAGLAVSATNYTAPSTSGVLVDAVAPVAMAVAASTANGVYKAGTDIAITLAFSEAVTVTGTPTLALSNGKLAQYTQGSGTTTLTFVYTTQAGDDVAHLDYASTGALQLGSATLRDAVGNDANLMLPAPGASGSLAANTQIAIDTVAPTATVTMASTSLKAGQTSLVTIAFNEAVTGFTNQNLSVTGGTLSTVASSDGGKTWTATFTPSADLTQATNTIILDKAGLVDAAGNTASGTTPSGNYSIDTLRPTATSIVVAESSLKAGQTSLVTITFSEAVTGFSSANLTVGGGTLSQVQSIDGGITWTATLTPANNQNSIGNAITLSPAGVQDAAGNTATGIIGSNTYAVHTVRPTATITVADSALKIGQTSQVTIAFSEAVNDFTNDDLTVAGGSLSPVQSSDGGITWTATLTPAANLSNTGNAISLDNAGVQNAAGNAGSGTTNSNTYAVDTVRPTASIVVVNPAMKTGQTSLVTITFSEAVTGFDNADLTVAGGSLSQVHSSDGGTTWSATFTPAADTEQTAIAITLDRTGVLDAMGNAGIGRTDSNTYAVDTKAPTLRTSTPLDDATSVNPTADFTLTFSENIAAAEGWVELRKTSDNMLVEQFDVTTGEGSLHGTLSIQGDTLTLNPHDDLAYDTGYYLLADFGLVKDSAGNYFGGISGPTALNFKTGSAPSDGGGSPVPSSTTVDGVSVTTQPGPGGSTVVTVPVVAPDRADTPGTLSTLADIPLVKAVDGHTVIGVSVPVGLGLQAESVTTTGPAQLAELVYRIERIAGSGDQALVRSGEAFTAALASSEPLTVQVLQLTPGAGFNPAVPLVITGSTSAVDGKQAIVLDARSLPSGTVIQVDNIDFIAVVGSVRLIGGAGQNVATGDNEAQWIVLGPDDDIIHGGGGNDIVGSEGGDDQVFGDAGDDTVFGGAGNDILSGGAGNDHLNGGTGFDVALQAGKRADYTVTVEGAGIKLVHTATGETEWLVDVEQVRFDSGPLLTVAHSATEEAAAYLFQKWLGRDLTQGEGAIVQTLEGKTALEVAALFAQVFPVQAAGKTAAQLLDGMASAGILRVDAVRDVTVTGDGGSNTIIPMLGLARYVDGGGGIDTVAMPGTLAHTLVQSNGAGNFTLQRLTDGAMLDLTRVERVRFDDTQLALDLDGHAGQAAKLIGALGGPSLLASKGLVGEAIRLLDAGLGEQGLAQLGLQVLGAQTPVQVAQLLWTNVIGRAGTEQELTILTDLMSGGVTASELAVMASNLDLNAARIDLVGLSAKGIEFA